MNRRTTALACVLAALSLSPAQGKEVIPEDFTGSDGLLNNEELIEYLLCKYNVTYARLRELGGGDEAKEAATANWTTQIRKGKPVSSLLTPAEVRAGDDMDPLEEDAGGDKGPAPLDGIFENSRPLGEHGKAGPFRVRAAVEDWSKELGDVTGASFSYQDDKKADATTWSAKGAVIYPLVFSDPTSTPGNPWFLSYSSTFAPAISWNVTDIAGTDEGDAQELTFSAPYVLEANHNIARKPGAGFSQTRSELSIAPFYTTDLSFESSILGASLTYEPLLQRGDFELGQYHRLPGTGAAYILRVLPKLDYSSVLETSEYVARAKDDDWVRAGGKVEVGIRPFGEDARWELRAAYSAMQEIGGEGDYSDMIEAKMLFWLTENAGLSLSYDEGETPVADKDIEMLKIGLELKL